MRYSSAAVLSTLVVGQAAAANIHNRHASFHARREAASKRQDPAAPVNWDALSYDLKDVNWEKVNWSSVFASSAAAATPTPEAAKPAPVVTPTPEAEKPKPKPAAPSSTEASSSTPAPKKTDEPTSDNPIGDLVDDVFAGVASIANKIGAKVGKNDKQNNGGIWIGDDSKWGMEVTNTGSDEAVYYCWQAKGFDGMSINKWVPDVSVGLKPGKSVKLSFAADVPAACAPATAKNALALFGGVDNTWAEVTFGQWGAFDVSRNVNMKGCNISMKGSKCLSDMETCVFKCNSGDSCEKGYDLHNCNASNGGGGGYDVVMQGTGGGCAMASEGEWIKVTFD
ncbi:hypothetical protein HBH42_154030 [Parastagonospora nodorum]|nr:hypothetical protein HBH42_154030 [Parastagonospora nodorum]